MKRVVWISFLALGACGVVQGTAPADEVAGETRATGVTTDILLRPRARPEGLAARLGRTAQPDSAAPDSVAPDPAAPASVAQGGVLGTTVASLGDPVEPGLWLKTPLVREEMPGRVRLSGQSAEVSVRLIPLDGATTAGSQISLRAMQELGVPLSDLPSVEVLAAGA